jgi:hypothetical protein
MTLSLFRTKQSFREYKPKNSFFKSVSEFSNELVMRDVCSLNVEKKHVTSKNVYAPRTSSFIWTLMILISSEHMYLRFLSECTPSPSTAHAILLLILLWKKTRRWKFSNMQRQGVHLIQSNAFVSMIVPTNDPEMSPWIGCFHQVGWLSCNTCVFVVTSGRDRANSL